MLVDRELLEPGTPWRDDTPKAEAAFGQTPVIQESRHPVVRRMTRFRLTRLGPLLLESCAGVCFGGFMDPPGRLSAGTTSACCLYTRERRRIRISISRVPRSSRPSTLRPATRARR